VGKELSKEESEASKGVPRHLRISCIEENTSILRDLDAQQKLVYTSLSMKSQLMNMNCSNT